MRYAIVKDKPVSVKNKLGQIYQKKEAKVSTARVMTKVQKVAQKMDKHRPDNAIQKVRGVDLTPEVIGRMTYGRISKTIYIGLIVQELTARSVDLSGAERSGVKALINLLKENEGDTKTFEPKTDLWGALAKLQDSN